MEHKPIYLDGVDVKNCNFFLSSNKYCGLYSTGCRFVPDCYFKQLARKTQELKTICKAFDIEYGHDEEVGAIVGRCNKLIEKEKELDEYKQSLDEKNKFLQDLGISAGGEFKRIKFYIENLKNKYDEKVKECEELISEKDFHLQKIETLEEKLNAQFAEMEEKLTAEEMKNYALKKKLRDLELKNTTLQNRNQQLDGSMAESDRYCEALEEIGKIVKINCEEICGRKFEDCNDFLCTSKNILDIINKAKGEGKCQ